MAKSINSKLQDVKRDLILDATSELLDSIGFDKLKVSELANEVGISVGTIYSMFESKEGLYLAYVQRQVDMFLLFLNEKCEGITDPKEELRMALTLKFEHFVQKRTAIEDCAKNNVFFFNNIHSGTDMLHEIIKHLALNISKINPKLSSVESEKLAYVIMSLSDGYVNHWLIVEDDLLSQIDNLYKQSIAIIEGYE